MPGFKVKERGLDVFTGSQRIDAEVYAVAGEPPPGDAADLDGI